jgi:putative membrane protein
MNSDCARGISEGNTPLIGASISGALLISVFLAWFTYGRSPAGEAPAWTAVLPSLAAGANAACFASLVAGWISIRRGRPLAHRRSMLTAVGFSAVFFAAYLLNHQFHGDTPFGGSGLNRGLYLALLATHILGSMVVLALLPMSLWFAGFGQFDAHRAVNRWLLPIWCYVSVTGVAVYTALHV